MAASKSICRVIASPSKIVSLVERKMDRSVLTLNIQRNQIEMAVAKRASNDETLSKEAEPLPPISGIGRSIDDDVINQFSEIIDKYNVGSFIVSWPLQKDTGKFGSPCGRVLYTLESIHRRSDTILTAARPVCLWGGKTSSASSCNADKTTSTVEGEDEWGRCSLYARTSSERLFLASAERYSKFDDAEAKDIWDGFCRAHWPELYVAPTKRSWNLVADWKQPSSSYVEAAAV